MLTLSRTINPECEHVQGDMRTLRLGRTFDAVFVHDAVMYMTTEDDLRAAIETAATHVRPRGVALFVPDVVRKTFSPGVDHGGHDGPDGRSLRYLEWTHDGDAEDTAFDVDFAIMLREPGAQVRVVHDRHVFGLFSRDTWLRLISEAGSGPSRSTSRSRTQASSKRSLRVAQRLDGVRKDGYPRCRTYVRHRDWRRDAHDPSTGDLAVPRRLRGRARLSADGA